MCHSRYLSDHPSTRYRTIVHITVKNPAELLNVNARGPTQSKSAWNRHFYALHAYFCYVPSCTGYYGQVICNVLCFTSLLVVILATYLSSYKLCNHLQYAPVLSNRCFQLLVQMACFPHRVAMNIAICMLAASHQLGYHWCPNTIWSRKKRQAINEYL